MGKDGRMGKNILCNIWYDKTIAQSGSSVKCSRSIQRALVSGGKGLQDTQEAEMPQGRGAEEEGRLSSPSLNLS